MTISNIFTLTNGGNGHAATKAALANVGKAPAADSAGAVFSATGSMVGRTGATGGDIVSISKLSQALTGRAAAFFSHMDEKARGKLESLVNAGSVSVDDAVRGLQHWADQTSFIKSMGQIPATAQEIDQQKLLKSKEAEFQEKMQSVSAVNTETEALLAEYAQAKDTGIGDLAEISKRIEANAARYQEVAGAARDVGRRGPSDAVVLQEGFARRFQIVADAKAASGHPDGAAMSNAADKAAADRLSDAGLGQGDLKSARLSFGATVKFPPEPFAG